MNRNYTPKRVALNIIGAFLLTLLGFSVNAQVNIALTATFVDHGGSTFGTGIPVLPPCPTPPAPGCTWGYGPYHYNDNNIPAFPATGSNVPPAANNAFTYVGSGGWIKFAWAGPQTFHKIVIYKNDRPMTSFELQVGGGANYTTVYTYNNVINSIADSFVLPVPVNVNGGDTLRFFNIQGPSANPSTREIQIWSAPPCITTPGGNTIVASTLSPCFGTSVFLNATSNNTSSGHAYQWQRSTDNFTWTSIPGANDPGYVFQAQHMSYFRVIDTCLGSATNTASNVIQINPTGAVTYQSVPYVQDFDGTWTTGCATAPYSNDVPGPGWTNNPAIGDSSWRRNDQTTTPPNLTANFAGWNNPLGGNLNPASPAPVAFSARFHSSQAMANIPGNLDLYVNLNSSAGDKQLYFYMLNMPSALPSDSLRVLLSTDAGFTWTRLAVYDTAGSINPADTKKWRKKSIPITATGTNAIIRFQAVRVATNEGTDIGIDSVYIAPECTGTPSAGTIAFPTTTLTCAGAQYFLTTNGTSMGGGLQFQWQYSTNGGAAWNPVLNGDGATTQSFTTPPIYDTVMYRLEVKCLTTGTPVYTAPVTINIAAQPQYAPIPYSQSFESWISRCNTSTPPGCTTCGSEVPGINWANWPATGNNSWRRHDQASTAGWTNNSVAYTPVSTHLNYSARFHSSSSTTGTSGALDLFVDCSSTIGDKELRFAYMNIAGDDSLGIWYAKHPDSAFYSVGSLGNNPNPWTYYSFAIPSNSATTVIRLKAYAQFGSHDIGIDSLTVIPPCSGAPNPGTISYISPCPGINFTMNLINGTFAGGLVYQWQQSPTGAAGSWTDILNATTQSYSTNILQNTYYRVRVICTATLDTVYTNVEYVQLAAFYYCYCDNFAQSPSGADIGNVQVMRLPGGSLILNNGNPTPLNNNPTANGTYSDFRYTIPPIVMYHDSAYAFFVTQINSSTFAQASVSIWIDTNRNGVFESTEQFLNQYTSASSNPPQRVTDTLFAMPDTAFVGITGMRVTMEQQPNSAMTACGLYANGETEDYLVDIRYPPCNGPVNPGIAVASDTTSCVGYQVTIIDTTHEKGRSDISWLWQYSPDGNTWGDVAGSQGRDTITQTIVGQSYYRLRMLCLNTLDTTFSNTVTITINPSYACYCFSQADGGSMDSSDIGAFMLDSLLITNNGPHVKNGTAFRARTDYTSQGIIHLYRDTSYELKVYHILRSDTHADAYITLFMDLNNDLHYNTTPTYTEKMWSGYTTNSTFFITDSVHIPANTIVGVKTGMRLILNNNISPNIPSDSACGTYTSGETEDYLVMFHDWNETSVASMDNITQMLLYPNPTEGRFGIHFMAKQPVENATITVTNVTGQKILEQHYSNPGKQMDEEFDLSGAARGVYFVELRADNEKIVRKVIVK